MAHFAELDETNTVLQVLVVHNDVTTVDGVEDEQHGIDFLNDIFPDSGMWVQTSYNSTIRHNYAGGGFTWDGTGFAPPRPYPSWTLDADYLWEPPTPKPDDGNPYEWNETDQVWVPA